MRHWECRGAPVRAPFAVFTNMSVTRTEGDHMGSPLHVGDARAPRAGRARRRDSGDGRGCFRIPPVHVYGRNTQPDLC